MFKGAFLAWIFCWEYCSVPVACVFTSKESLIIVFAQDCLNSVCKYQYISLSDFVCKDYAFQLDTWLLDNENGQPIDDKYLFYISFVLRGGCVLPVRVAFSPVYNKNVLDEKVTLYLENRLRWMHHDIICRSHP